MKGFTADGGARPAFVFPGQGSVWPRMAAGLLDGSPVFARRLGECADALAPHVGWSLMDVVRSEDPSVYDRANVSEPALFAIQLALADLWRSHGVEPHAVAGYSLGEVSAACAAGALSLEEAARVIALWSEAQARMTGPGAMALLALPREEAEALLAPHGSALSIAGVLAPRSVVVAGDRDAITRTVAELRTRGTYAQQLSLALACHSPQAEEQREWLLDALGEVECRDSDIPFHSSVTGGPLPTRGLDAGYWYRNMRQAMLFEQVTRGLLADGHTALIELSPHPVLTTAMRSTVEAAGATTPVLGTLRRGHQGLDAFRAALAEASAQGVAVSHGIPASPGSVAASAADGVPLGAACAVPLPRDPLADAGELVEAVCALIVAELRGEPAREVTVGDRTVGPDDHDTSLFDLGFDSVELVTLQDRLQRQLDVRLESTFIIDHPTIGALVRETGNRVERRAAAHRTPSPVNAPDPSEPIAVIGMSFRLPGGIDSPERYWKVLSEQIDVVGEIPADRWRQSPLDIAEVTTSQGGYLKDVDRFDPLFFKISPHEAELLDPQQRLILELTWEAFEGAGIDPFAAGQNSRVGTFVGIYNNDYQQVGADLGHSPEAYTYTGNMANAAAGRISYVYGFRGPSMAIDTACSSSLYAVHLGMRELRQGGCDLVVAAGVNLILSPEVHLSWSRLSALSPTGRCRSFDDGADGYIRSEGGAVVVLKRLSDAERDGDRVLAVLSGSAVNHNGRSGGFTVPSGTAQADVIETALADAGVGIDDISYVETHGSGTPIGDPQEVNALARVFADRTAKLPISSVKSNLGHLESAAGMAALCKVVLSLEHGRLPGTLHFRTGNRMIDWANIPIEVIAEEIPWEPAGGKRRAGISSLGISGTNAHVIVEEYHPREATNDTPPAPGLPQLLTVSGPSRTVLRTALEKLAEWSRDSAAPLADVAHTLGRRRALPHREALVCDALTDLPASVGAALDGDEPLPAAPAGEVFVFSGQGTQYPGMARELYEHAGTFRRELDELDRAFARTGGISLLDVMFGEDESAFAAPLYTQPMIFAVELALARYWQSLGITPAAVLGHSIGEYAAACFAGVMSRDQAVDLVMRRARVMEDTPRDGGMATLLCSPERAGELLGDHPEVSVAAVNAAENVTVSGAGEALGALLKAARKKRIFVERLAISHPFHSPGMARGADELYEQIRDQRFAAPEIPWISAQTGRPVTADSVVDAAYWSRHLVDPVLFRDAVGTAVGQGFRVFVEVASMATLGGLIAQDHRDVVNVPSLRKGRSDVRQFLESAGLLWKLGRTLDRDGLPGTPGKLVRGLPHTPFDRQRIWYRDRTGEGSDLMSPDIDKAAGAGATGAGTAVDTAAAKAARRTAERETVQEFLARALGQITGAAGDTMDDALDLFSLGVDSLMLVQLAKRIDKRFAVDIPIKIFFESLHTLGQLTDFVQEHRPEEPLEQSGAEAPAPAEVPVRADAPVVTAPAPAPVAATPAALAPVPAALPDGPAASGLEAVVRTQLALMQQQLTLLGGGAPAPAPASAAVAPVAQAPSAAAPARSAAPAVSRKVGSYDNNITLDDDRLNDRQSRFIEDFVARYVARTRRSKEYADTFRGTLADWIASLNFNPSVKETVYPVVSARSSGATFWDLDGNEYIDTAIGYGVHIFGHNPDFIRDAIRAQLDHGFELGPQNSTAGEVARLIHEMTGAERVAFCNTGTEAVMVSLRLARAVSGRDRVARFTNSYHGSSDGVLAESDGVATVPLTIGVPQAMVDNTVVLAYGYPDTLEEIRRQGPELAAVLVEPVQSRNPDLQPAEFLRELREICTEHGIALIFDEMITGFRVGVGGAQEHFGVRADIALYGKLVAGGMPIGIVAGRAAYLDAVDGGAWTDTDDSRPAARTTFFAGTFCKHPLSMAASRAVLTRLKESGAERLAELNAFTAEFAQRVNAYLDAEEVPLKLAHFASMYKWEPLAPRDVVHTSLTQNLFFKLLNHHGVYVWERRTGNFSFAHTREHQDRILAAIRTTVEEMRAGGFDFRRRTSTAALPATTGAAGPGTAVERRQDGPAEVTSLEERVYVLSRMRGGNEAYQVVFSLRFDAPLDPERVAEAFRAIADRHPNLRRGYEVDADGLRARVAAEITPESHLFDRRNDPGLSAEDIMAVLNRPLDLAKPPLWRYGIVIDPDGTHHLIVSFHHIVVDGRSVEIIFDDLAAHLTHGRLDDRSTEGAEGDGGDDYATFVRSLAEAPGRPEYAEHRQWWLKQFATVPAPLNLPTDAPHPVVNDFGGRRYYTEIDRELYRAASAVIREQRTTPPVFYLSLWALLLAQATGEDDLCVGVPMDLRLLGSFERTVGMFAESLPLRIRPTADTRVSDLFRQVREVSHAAMNHALYPYSELVQELDLARDHGHNALFDTMFIHTNAKGRAHRFGEAGAVTDDLGARGSMFAFTFELTERDGGLFADLNYSTVYGEQRIAGLMEQFRILLARVVENPDRTIGELSAPADGDRERLLEWGTGPVVPELPSLQELFEAARERHAEQPAIRFRGTDLTYAELAGRVDRCAAFLQAHGAAPGDVIGLLLPPSPELIVLMLAVNRVGCSWLPMDVKMPVARLRDIIGTADPATVVCTADAVAGLELGARPLVLPDGELPDGPVTPVAAAPDDLAYTIFTSGSTGRPKGVMVTNGSLANFLRGMEQALRWNERRTVACLTTPSFDIYLLETLLTLVTGGTVAVAEENDVRTPAGIAEFVVRNGVHCVQLTPTRLRLLHSDTDAAFEALGSLEKLIVGGEAFPGDLLPQLRAHEALEIFNVYGPTETCVWSSVKELTGDGEPTIGTPIANTTCYVLDDQLRPVPEGTAGNLWIGGLGVSPGYLHRPDLTRELFRENPFGEGRIYLSGDQALWRDGELHCLGRIDNQVKIRGYRIELEEIERAIAGHDRVTAAAAVVQRLSPGHEVVRGFFQAAPGGPVDPAALREFLTLTLPDYMIPATLTEVPEIPMTTSGKVDRPALARRAGERPDEERPDEERGGAARPGVDQELFAAWRKLLGDIPIGYDDSFFDLGGNSFSLVLLLNELEKTFPGLLDVSDLFANPTIGRLRTHLEEKLARREPDGPVTETGVVLPDTWFAAAGQGGGRVEAVLPERIRDGLARLRKESDRRTEELLPATFALTLGKVLARAELTLCVVRGTDGVAPVRLDLAGKADLLEIVDEYVSGLGTAGRTELERFTSGRNAEGRASIAWCDTRQPDEAGLLRHFDIVLAVDSPAAPSTVAIGYARKIDSAAVERLLNGFIRLLGMLSDPPAKADQYNSQEKGNS
ncbi:amino acid adenylation domain-containing protein [Streptomyces sp. NPDC000594]|uniref:non-ribosomal peptide synthetase/type I polyketide synthase n=1 Tax=Streptomyces sp. NPDC000594 TaxID=3154261 RepID=UPI00331893F5